MRVLISDSFKNVKADSNVLRAANPQDCQFTSIEDWRSCGVRVIIMTKAASIGVNGLDFIEHLAMWRASSIPYRQLFGRFDRPADR